MENVSRSIEGAAGPGTEKNSFRPPTPPHNAPLHRFRFITEDWKSNGDERKTKSTWDVYYIIQIQLCHLFTRAL